ncbi:uncharacterized protein LOC133200233 [Saccostrea echinata]|uniref:uncharacterized protein LOC133200233 n=1 Tax=Saccostrea echinata TaxID=191078 RepID=UPI002A7F7609|nr:uncharacterized protein LOC133200233 [Saccostrea echinata]
MDKTQYSFPLLPADQLVQDLNIIADLPLEEKDFKQPNSQRWQKIYCRLVEVLSGVSFESIIQQVLYVKDEMEFPELYEEATEIVLLSLTLKRMLSSCGIADFSLKDVKEPSPNRVLKIMCAIANFIKFQQGRIQVYQDLKEENDRFRDQFDHMIQKRDRLKAKIQELKAEKPKNDPEFAKIQEQLDILNDGLQERLRKQSVKQKAATEVKARLAEKIANRDKVKLAITQAEEEGQKLSQKIVQSPEKVMEEQDMMKVHLVELRGNLERKRQQLEAKRQQVEEFKVSISNNEKATKLLHNIKVDVDAAISKANDIKAYREKTVDKKDSMRDLRKKIEIVEENISNRQEKLYKLALQQQNKNKGMQETLNQLQEQRLLMMQHFSDKEKGLRELEEQKQHLLNVLQERQRAHAEKANGIMGLYSELVGAVDKYHTKIGVGWNKVRDAFND